jgi:hypothetical protein
MRPAARRRLERFEDGLDAIVRAARAEFLCRVVVHPASGRRWSVALIATWVFIRAFVAFEGGMWLGFNTREAPDESHDAACEGKSEHC